MNNITYVCVIFSVRLFAFLHEFVCFLNTFVYFCMRINVFVSVCMKFYIVYKNFQVSLCTCEFLRVFMCIIMRLRAFVYVFACVLMRLRAFWHALIYLYTCVCVCCYMHICELNGVCVRFQVRITLVIYAFVCYIIQMHWYTRYRYTQYV